MINRKIAISAVSIFAAFALVAGGTLAFFTDTATSTGNSFSSGNADLQIALDPLDPLSYSGNIAGFTNPGMFPGFSQDYKFWLRNASVSQIGLDNTVKVDGLSGDSTLQGEVTLNFSCVRQSDSNTVVTGDISLTSLAATPVSIGSLLVGDLSANGLGTDEALCTMTVKDPTTSTVVGQNVSFNLLFNATQTP